MEETNNVNNSGKALWLTVVFAIIFLGLVSFFWGNPFSLLNKKEAPRVVTTETKVVPVEQTVAMLNSRISFPTLEVKTSTASNVVALGKDLSVLILTDSTSQEIKKESYGSGSNGWYITYKYSDGFDNVYNKLYTAVRDGGFTITLSSRSVNAAIISGQSSKYRIKVMIESLGDKDSVVKINILDNK